MDRTKAAWAVIENINQELTNEMPLLLLKKGVFDKHKYWKSWLKKYSKHYIAKYLGLYVHIPFCSQLCSFCACAKNKLSAKKEYLKFLYKSLYMKVSQTILTLRDYRPANIRRFVMAINLSKSVVAIKITSNLRILNF